jgi:anaerobic carbon-monoxide dehydrogenase iron sulfur subunit
LKLTVVPERCSGCHLCELACSIKHFGVNNPKKSNVKVMIVYPAPVIRMPVFCHQCKEAKCAENCPVECISHEDGVVKIDTEECIGCEQCIVSCPFGAIFSHEDYPAPFKCDLCGGEPECAKVCPTKALIYVPKHLIGQAQRMSNVLKYAHMKQVEYFEKGEKKLIHYTETEKKEKDNNKKE